MYRTIRFRFLFRKSVFDRFRLFSSLRAGMGGTILGGKDDAGGHSDPKAAWTQSKGDPVLSSLYNVDRPGGAYLV
jgi:hypothetical protein